MSELARLRAVVYGHVQGVNFRVVTRRQAESLGLVGWVRNQPDGNVEVMAEGARPRLQQLLNWLHVGPTAARVYEVHATWADADSEFTHFTVRF